MPKPPTTKTQNPKPKTKTARAQAPVSLVTPARQAFPKNPTSVVTGGAGFLGSHLIDHLLARGHHIIAIDNLITGNLDNLAHIQRDPIQRNRFTFLKHDVTQHIHIPGPVHYIWHLASPASPVDYLQLPIQTLKVGSLGTHNTLGLARAKNARYLLASTSETYGDPLIHPQPETYWGHVNTLGPRGCYDEAKRFAEAITVAYQRQHHIDARIVRIFNTYGPRMRLNDGRVVPAFLTQALTNQPITLFGKGTQTRSFCYVTDLIQGIYRLMNLDTTTLPRPRHPRPSTLDFPWVVNIGNPHELTILQFAQQIIRLTRSKSKITYKPLPQDDPKQRRPDITRARQWLRWQPKTALPEGLKHTITHFKPRIQPASLLRST